jgi:hypothetical protein
LKVHFLTYVLIPEKTNINRAVAERLAPFAANKAVEPWKRHLPPGGIAAMARHFRVRSTEPPALAAVMDRWCGSPGGVDVRSLFALTTRNPDATWDWYAIGGRWDGFLPGNAATCRSLLHSPGLQKLLPHDFVAPDGVWHARQRFVSTDWCEGRWLRTSTSAWLAEFRLALSAPEGGLVVCVDRHV